MNRAGHHFNSSLCSRPLAPTALAVALLTTNRVYGACCRTPEKSFAVLTFTLLTTACSYGACGRAPEIIQFATLTTARACNGSLHQAKTQNSLRSQLLAPVAHAVATPSSWKYKVCCTHDRSRLRRKMFPCFDYSRFSRRRQHWRRCSRHHCW